MIALSKSAYDDWQKVNDKSERHEHTWVENTGSGRKQGWVRICSECGVKAHREGLQ